MKEESPVDKYVAQMAEKQAIFINEHFKFIVKPKPRFMPSWLYKMLIRELVTLQWKP